MEIPELIIALQLKMKMKAEAIKEQERKLNMAKHDLKIQKKDVEGILKDIDLKDQ